MKIWIARDREPSPLDLHWFADEPKETGGWWKEVNFGWYGSFPTEFFPEIPPGESRTYVLVEEGEYDRLVRSYKTNQSRMADD